MTTETINTETIKTEPSNEVQSPPCSAGTIDRLLMFATAALLGLIFWRTIYDTFEICFVNDDYSHGMLLPLISAYLIWERRAAIQQTIQARRNEPAASRRWVGGVALFTAGLLLLLVGRASDLMWIKWTAFFPTIIGLIAAVFGYRVAAIIAPPIVLNFMAKPFPDSLVPKLFFPLQALAAKIAAHTLEILGVPVYLFGNIIEIPGMRLMVEEACSGMRSMMAILTVAVIVAYTIRTNWLGKFLLFIGSIILAIVLNVVRVTVTGILAHFYDPSAASGFFHSFSGMVVFVVGLISLFGLGKIVERFLPAKTTAAEA